jgi:HSP20 family protein
MDLKSTAAGKKLAASEITNKSPTPIKSPGDIFLASRTLSLLASHAMKHEDPLAWMWIDACEMVSRAERLHRRVFGVTQNEDRFPCWEPPVDIFETSRELKVIVLLPGVAEDKLHVGIDAGLLTITGSSPFPGPAKAHIHRLEIPYGDFQKRLQLPSAAYELEAYEYRDGCLTIRLNKTAGPHP